MKTIFHLDMDAFFVSVEELYNPELKGKPVVVGGQANQRGVVSAASYAARKFGVHSAMPLRTAYKLCPQAIFVDGHPKRYKECSEQVFRVLRSFSPQVEMASIDEAYLDLTGSARLHGPPLMAAHKLHEKIQERTRLNCSIGVATSRLVAKICSDLAKPNGVLCIMPGEEARFLAPLDVRKIPGVGKVTEKGLHDCGIRKIGDLAKLDESFLEQRFGKWGLALAGKARGLDAGGWFDGEVGDHDEPKSISHETTFHEDSRDVKLIEATLAKLSEMVGSRLREHKLYARTVQLKLRYSDFSTFTRAVTLDHATQLDIDLVEQSRRLFHANWTGKAVRLLGINASNLQLEEGQISLLEGEKHDRWKNALGAVDRIRGKYGTGSVSLGSSMGGGFRERVHESPADLPGRHKHPDDD
ncbi:MAG: DNA polymerase IV [Bryobacterales bacterium]|nr:DNA polymerase IV [Bryobacterales bacterium]